MIGFDSEDDADLREKVRLLLELVEAMYGHPPANGVAGGPLLLWEEKGPGEDASKWN